MRIGGVSIDRPIGLIDDLYKRIISIKVRRDERDELLTSNSI